MANYFSYLTFLGRILGVSAYKKFNFRFQMPYKYIFLLTNRCDSRCKTCRIWKIYQENPTLMEEELTLGEYEKIFENIKNDVYWLNFSGGEPFLREDLVDLSRLANKKFKKLIFFSIPTNGQNPILIKKKVDRILEIISGVDLLVTVSIDGNEKINDFIRGKGGSYKKSIRTYEILKKFEEEFKNFKVGIQLTLSQYNMCKIKDFIEKFEGDIYYTFAQESSYFNNVNTKVGLRRIDKGITKKNIEYIEKSHRIKNFNDFLYKLYLKLARKYYKNPKKLVLPCYATYSTATVDCYGDVLPCSYFNSSVGNLENHNYDLKKIFKNEKMKTVRNQIKSEKCRRCWTNCDGLPTLIQNFPLSLIKSVI